MGRERSSFFEKFNKQFEDLLPDSRGEYRKIFDRATNVFEQQYGIAPYSSWNSFKSQRSKHRKK